MLVKEDLSLYLLNEQFGLFVAQSAKVLLKHGNPNLKEFLSFGSSEQQLNEDDLRTSLGTLLHHQLASFTLPVSDQKQIIDPSKLLSNKAIDLPQTEIRYTLDIESIILRLRFPFFIQLATELGNGEGDAMKTMCLMGRSSMKELQEKFKEDNPGDEGFTTYFSSLFKSQFIRKASGIHDKRVVVYRKLPVDMWELDIQSLLNKIRYQSAVQMVIDKLDSTCGDIAYCFLSLSTGAAAQMGLLPEQQFFSKEQVLETFQEKFPSNPLTETNLAKYLELMANDYTIPMLSKSATMATFAINVNAILKVVKTKHFESILAEMLGVEALRIFRMLLDYKYMEESQISTVALIDPADVRKLLYKMQELEFVSFQEVPKGLDYAPGKTFYLWNANVAAGYKSLIGLVLNSILKLKQRISHETKTHKYLCDKVETSSNDPSVQITQAEKVKYASIVRALDTLHASVQKMAGVYMILQFYTSKPAN